MFCVLFASKAYFYGSAVFFGAVLSLSWGGGFFFFFSGSGPRSRSLADFVAWMGASLDVAGNGCRENQNTFYVQ